MTRRPAFLTVFHKAWIALATAVLLASCTVVPAPNSYSYQPTACPPGVAANTAPPANTAPAPNGQPAPAACYTAVPNSYTYSYYPSTYPAYPAYPAYGYPYGYPAYYGPTIGVGFGFGGGWHHHHHW